MCQCTDGLCHAKRPRCCRESQHSSGIEPISPNSLQPVLITEPLVCINCSKKKKHDWSYFATCNLDRTFCLQDAEDRNAYRTVVLRFSSWRFFKLNRILERTPLIDTSYCILHRLELKYFHPQTITIIFCSMLIKQLIDLEKVRTDNLKFRTDLRNWVMDGWSVTKYMNVYKGRLLKKSSNRKLKLVLSMMVTS